MVLDASGRTRIVSARTGTRSARTLGGAIAASGSKISLSVTERRGTVFDQIDGVCGRGTDGRSRSMTSPPVASAPITRVPRFAVESSVASGAAAGAEDEAGCSERATAVDGGIDAARSARGDDSSDDGCADAAAAAAPVAAAYVAGFNGSGADPMVAFASGTTPSGAKPVEGPTGLAFGSDAGA